MKLYLDENISPRIADALSGLGVRDVAHVGTLFPEARRAGRVVEDEEWIAAVGEGGWLAATRDRRILQSPQEIAPLIEHRAGLVVIAATGPSSLEVLAFLMRRWEWLHEIDAGQERPFTYVTTLDGEPELVDLAVLGGG